MSPTNEPGVAVPTEVSGETRIETGREPAQQRNFVRWDIVALILIILLCAAIRWRLREMPLERDEGEYGYAGQLILQGIPPYQIAYNMKLPGTYAAYALMMAIFGQTAAGIHVGLTLVNALTILMVYAIGKRLSGGFAGVVAAATYGLLSVGPWVNGFAGHATHFVVFAAMAGLWLLLKAIDEHREWMIFLAGWFFGLAFVMKQPGAAFGIFGVLYLLKIGSWKKGDFTRSFRHLVWFGAGAVLPFAVTCVVLWRAGVFAKFWFWTFSYAYQYGTNVSGAEGWQFFVKNFPKAALSAIALWLLAALGLTSFLWSRKARAHADFFLGLLFFSGLAVSASFYFRRHYFILLLPAVALLAGVAISSAANLADQGKRSVLRNVAVAVFILAFASALLQEKYFFFQADPISASRYVYPNDPFAESVEIGRYIREHTSPSATIAVLGSEPQIIFYSQRRSVTGFLYAYSLTEEQKYATTMQREAISEIDPARPEYLVFVQDWELKPRSDTTILAWYRTYAAENYELVGVMRLRDDLQLRSEDEIRKAPGNMRAAVLVFRRKTA